VVVAAARWKLMVMGDGRWSEWWCVGVVNEGGRL
jgi:hypothetical protein